MLALQREFHCYNSARLEAAVEALEQGRSFEEVGIRMSLSFSLFFVFILWCRIGC